MPTLNIRHRLGRLWPGPRGLILLYHRVIRLRSDPYGVCTSPELFRRHLEVIRRHADPIPLEQLAAGRPGVALTFDDGYFDNLSEAAPALEEFGVPATFFVTSRPPAQFWWDELEAAHDPVPAGWRWWHAPEAPLSQAYRRLARLTLPEIRAQLPGLAERPSHRLLSRAELRALAARPGVTLGCHTLSHERLPLLPPWAQREDMRQSRLELGQVTGLAYPYGAHARATLAAARGAGFDYACLASPGWVLPWTDRFALPRCCADGLSVEALARWL